MARFFLVCFLFLADGFVGLAMGSAGSLTSVQSKSNPPAPTPSRGNQFLPRKRGKHQQYSMVPPSYSPSIAPQPVHSKKEETSSLHQAAPSALNNEDNSISIKGQEIHLQRRNRHSVDKSVAGGGVILGGLATTFLVAIFCYIRATGRHKPDATV